MKQKLFSVTLSDCKVDTFTVGGHGGSGKDTSNTGVRITHPPSKAVGKATDSRSQLANKRLAFRRMGETKEFRNWARMMAIGIKLEDVEIAVEAMLESKNLKVEVWTDGSWKVCDESQK